MACSTKPRQQADDSEGPCWTSIPGARAATRSPEEPGRSQATCLRDSIQSHATSIASKHTAGELSSGKR